METNKQNETFSIVLKCSFINEIVFITAIVQCAICLLGIVGNVMSAIVLVQPSMRNSTAILLVVLAVYDFFFVAVSFFIGVVPPLLPQNEHSNGYLHVIHVITFKYSYGLLHLAHTGTIYMTVLVTIERAVVVVFPFQAKRVCTQTRAGVASLLVLVWSVFYNIPRFMEYDSDTNEILNATVVETSSFGQSYFYNVVYLIYINSVFHFILPVAIIIILNITIIQRLYKRGRSYIAQVSSCGESQVRLTAIIIAITTVFCANQILGLLELVLYPEPALDQQGEKQYLNICAFNRRVMNELIFTVTLINSATNFIIFNIFSQKFRQCLKNLCCCCPLTVLPCISRNNIV